MAVTEEIFKIEINVNDATKNTQELAKEVAKLTEQTKAAKEQNGELSEEYIQYNAALKGAKTELRQNEKVLIQLTNAQKENAGTLVKLEARNNELRLERRGLNRETEDGIKREREINRELDANNTLIKESSDAFKQQKLNVGNYTNSILDATDVLDEFAPAATNAIGSIKAMSQAALKFIKTGFGAAVLLIVGVFKLLQGAFNRSLSSQEKLNKITGKLSAAWGLLLDALIPVVEFILENVLAAFNKIGDAVVFVIDKLAQWGIISEETNKKVQKTLEETSEATDNLATAERQLIKSAIELEKLQLRSQTAAEKLRQIRDDESKSTEDRIKANEKLAVVLSNQLAAEFKQANAVLTIARQRQLVNNESLESIQEIGDAEIKLLEIQERITSQRSEQLVNQVSLEKELAEERAEIRKKESEEENAQLEADLMEEERLVDEQSQRLLAKANKIKEDAKLIKDQEKAAAIIDKENELALLSQDIFSKLDLEREGLKAKEQQEIESAEKIGANTTLIEEKYSNARKELNKAEQDAKLSLAADFVGNIAKIAGEGTAIGKAAAVAQTTISTFQAAQGAYASLAAIPVVGPVLGIAAAAAAVAAGVSNVKKILAVDSGLPSGGSGGGGGASPSSAAIPSVSAQVPTQPLTAQIGQGIVTREQVNNNNTVISQPVLLTDSVTLKQSQINQNQETAVI